MLPATCKYSTKWLLTTVVLALLAFNGVLTLPAAANDSSTNAMIYDYKLLPPINELEPPTQLDIELKGLRKLSMKGDKLNLTAITWAHAVNSQQLLNEALSSDVDMIEADIVLGKINDTGADLPVMAHPPATTSDISLADFLNQIMLHNEKHAVKGVKLDFKSIEVFEGSLDILSEKIPMMNYPIWLNADIISGPVNQTSTVPVDPARFFAGSAQFEKSVLSIGWTTRWGAAHADGAYAPNHIDDMIAAIEQNNVTATRQPITFPVRAGIAANSRDELHRLVRAVNETNESTLTIWSSDNDFVNVEKLRQLIFSFGFERVYLDVPDKLAKQLDLGRVSASPNLLPSLFGFAFINLCSYFASAYLELNKL